MAAGPVLGLPEMRKALLVDVPAAEPRQAQACGNCRHRTGVVLTTSPNAVLMRGYVFVGIATAGLVAQDIDDPDADDDDDFEDEDDEDSGEDEEDDDEEVETWQVSNRIRNAKGPARLDFGR